MVFSSPAFLFLFLPITLLGIFLARRAGMQYALSWLGIASAGFYAWWYPPSLLLLGASVAFNYLAGGRIRAAPTERSASGWLAIAVTANLLALAFFKYSAFIAESLAALLQFDIRFDAPSLPLGISFFTFTQIAYLVDVRRRKALPTDFRSYWLFVTYFPHLIAGPVLHHAQFLPQLQQRRALTITPASLAVGTTLLAIGLAKKTLLADPLGAYASAVFGDAAMGARPLLIEAWTGALCYTFQLYFDFSGYSDMALGLSRMLNLRLPVNFLSPYKATSIIDFWRRWHISLSSFLRDYLYIPLGGNRHGTWRTRLHMLITMVLGGLWHGAGWTFVAWGGFHGVLLVLNHGWRELLGTGGKAGIRAGPAMRLAGTTVTFGLVVIGWTLFRAENLPTAFRMLEGMAGFNGLSLPEGISNRLPMLGGSWLQPATEGLFAGSAALRNLGPNRLMLLLTLSAVVVWCMPNAAKLFRRWSVLARPYPPAIGTAVSWRPALGIALVTGLLLALAVLGIQARSEFLYFQF